MRVGGVGPIRHVLMPCEHDIGLMGLLGKQLVVVGGDLIDLGLRRQTGKSESDVDGGCFGVASEAADDDAVLTGRMVPRLRRTVARGQQVQWHHHLE